MSSWQLYWWFQGLHCKRVFLYHLNNNCYINLLILNIHSIEHHIISTSLYLKISNNSLILTFLHLKQLFISNITLYLLLSISNNSISRQTSLYLNLSLSQITLFIDFTLSQTSLCIEYSLSQTSLYFVKLHFISSMMTLYLLQSTSNIFPSWLFFNSNIPPPRLSFKLNISLSWPSSIKHSLFRLHSISHTSLSQTSLYIDYNTDKYLSIVTFICLRTSFYFEQLSIIKYPPINQYLLMILM